MAGVQVMRAAASCRDELQLLVVWRLQVEFFDILHPLSPSHFLPWLMWPRRLSLVSDILVLNLPASRTARNKQVCSLYKLSSLWHSAIAA